jgi:hypothetical protein
LKGREKKSGKGEHEENDAGYILCMLETRQFRRKEHGDKIATFNWEEIKMDRHREILDKTVPLTVIFPYSSGPSSPPRSVTPT